ncbi:DUF4185 domain-containing protein [Salininema proteolyticum]|uniref:DUF4185 domain-containing protein n=1 Tax=Salininema proteolyticum TaxID=1607685 RepID=A0ABV8TXF3_9ACTN
MRPLSYAGVAIMATALITVRPAAVGEPPTGADPDVCGPATIDVADVRPDAEPEGAFLDYAESTPDGWTGADSTYSVRLPDGGLLWLFSDTFLGPLNDDGTRPVTAPLVNNSFVLQEGDAFTTVQGGTPSRPEAIMPPDRPGHWYWLGDGMISHQDGTDHLQVVFQEYRRFGDGDWDFRLERNAVATFALDDLTEPVRVDDLPSQGGAWGSALLPASESGDGHTYVYGLLDSDDGKTQRIARVPGEDLSDTANWSYWSPEGWTDDENAAGAGLAGVANEYSVTPWNGQYLLLTQDTSVPFSTEVRAYTSCSPAGPFTNGTLVYRMPETGAAGSYGDKDVYAYNAHLHDTLADGDTLVMSYNVNHLDSGATEDSPHYRDPSIYKPRFVEVSLTPGNPRQT